MKKIYLRTCIFLLALSLMVPVGGFSQDTGTAPPVFRQEELDQMLAPIALYPDSLLIQILMASTYPLEIVQEARWMNQNPSLKGAKLAAALETKPWDPSVKSLVNFPQVLAMLNEKLDWTQNLGDAFLGQRDQVMATIQDLRAKAQAAGYLKSNSEQVVVVQEKTIVIEPASPEVLYVPAYNPTVVYGTWWYPSYPPYYYYPPGYTVAAASVISFGVGVACGVAWGYAWGGVNWSNHQVYVAPPPPGGQVNYNYSSTYIQRNVNINNTVYNSTTSAGAVTQRTFGTGQPASGQISREKSTQINTPQGTAQINSQATHSITTDGQGNAQINSQRNIQGSGHNAAGQTASGQITSQGSKQISTDGQGNAQINSQRSIHGSGQNAAGQTASGQITSQGATHVSTDGQGNAQINSQRSIHGSGQNAAGQTMTTGQGTAGSGASAQGMTQWQHDPSHRRGVAYKDPGVQKQFGQTASAGAASRQNFRGFNPSGTQSGTTPFGNMQNQGKSLQGGSGQGQQTFNQKKSGTGLNQTGSGQQFKKNAAGSYQQQGSSASHNRSSGAIQNLNRSGSEVKQQSSRGQSSRQSLPTQFPNQTQSSQGRKFNQGGGGFSNPGTGGFPKSGSGGSSAFPKSGGAAGGGSVPKFGGGGGSFPKAGGGNLPKAGGGNLPNAGGGNLPGAGGGGHAGGGGGGHPKFGNPRN